MSGAVIDARLVLFWAMRAKTMWQLRQATQVFIDCSVPKIYRKIGRSEVHTQDTGGGKVQRG